MGGDGRTPGAAAALLGAPGAPGGGIEACSIPLENKVHQGRLAHFHGCPSPLGASRLQVTVFPPFYLLFQVRSGVLSQ